MSFNRKNWSALSSLARQRTLEDEEEQARERRRRDRNLSSTTDAEDEALSPVQDPNKQAVERLRRPKEAEPPAAATAEEVMSERKLTAVLRPQEIRRQRWQVESSGNLRKEKEQPESCREPDMGAGRLEAAPCRGSARDGKALAGEQHQGLAQEPTGPKAEQCPGLAPEQKIPVGEQHQGLAQDEKDLIADEPPQEPEVTGGQPWGSAREQKDRSHLEVKVFSRGGSRIEQKPDSPVTRPSSQQDTAKNPPRAQETAGSPSTQDRPGGSSVASPTQVTYSSSFKRISPRTVSFRVISRKDKEENALTRSASVRHPANSVRIEEKLEKYTSAVQRSEVKSPVTMPRGFHPSLEGVASKRSIFEANAPSKADPAPVRKENLRLPGVVSSRINLWISRAQEPSKDGRVKDPGRTDSATKRNLWAKRPDDSSSDTRL
ncbi:THAP domain-containing protein 7 [Platysternon megacephalum]|uniref:THAP domain-containing protein 7 n=1 Tax=Platysternon megacephalum TaxID=55544 RepID=A0A4D9E0L0_9SAUR|nr:THAP domain-containing protein 7 [Platysternon megacephalum]